MNKFLIFTTTLILSLISIYLYTTLYDLPFNKTKLNYSKFYSSYESSRNEFRNLVNTNNNYQLITLPINNPYNKLDDLSIDIALHKAKNDSNIKNNPKTTIIHISGTHGVESYAGSNIQIEFLKNYNIKDLDNISIILVHGYNPYGFKYNRRYNENNIDLNRNCIMNETFNTFITNRDPNIAYYNDFNELLNPNFHNINSMNYYIIEIPKFIMKAIYNLYLHGYHKLMKTLVTGQYHFNQGLNYGGNTLQLSHITFQNFILSQKNWLKKQDNIIVIDVHTGLGKQGQDTLLLDKYSNITTQEILNIVPYFNPLYIESLNDNSNQSLSTTGFSAYQYTRGFQSECFHYYIQLINKDINYQFITEEFGTVPGILVFYGLRQENAFYHHINHTSILYQSSSKFLNDIFNIKKITWQNNIINKGYKLLKYIIKYYQ